MTVAENRRAIRLGSVAFAIAILAVLSLLIFPVAQVTGHGPNHHAQPHRTTQPSHHQVRHRDREAPAPKATRPAPPPVVVVHPSAHPTVRVTKTTVKTVRPSPTHHHKTHPPAPAPSCSKLLVLGVCLPLEVTK